MFDFLIRRWPIKLLAVLIAFAIWVAVIGENRVIQDFRVPLDVALRQDAILVGEAPTSVMVRLRGPETLLQRVEPLGMELRVDLRDAAAGERNVQLSGSQLFGIPSGLEVASLEPVRLRLVIDKRAKLSLAVQPVLAGRPEAGYHCYGSIANPERLEVEGPRASLAGLGRLRTDPIRLEGHYAPFTARVGAVVEQPDVRVTDPKPVEVRVLVDEAPIDQSFDGVPVVFANQAFDSLASPAVVRAVLTGPRALLRSLRPGQARAVADLAGLTPRTAPYPVSIRIDFANLTPEQRARLTVRIVSRPRVDIRVSDRRFTR